jgi:hypothetical protein
MKFSLIRITPDWLCGQISSQPIDSLENDDVKSFNFPIIYQVITLLERRCIDSRSMASPHIMPSGNLWLRQSGEIYCYTPMQSNNYFCYFRSANISRHKYLYFILHYKSTKKIWEKVGRTIFGLFPKVTSYPYISRKTFGLIRRSRSYQMQTNETTKNILKVKHRIGPNHDMPDQSIWLLFNCPCRWSVMYRYLWYTINRCF